MKQFLYFILLLLFHNGYSQDLIAKADITYGQAPDWQNNIQKLKLDLFRLPGENRFPLIIFLHGGGFEESKKEGCMPFCRRLARSGFIVANVEYRTGFEQSFGNYKAEISKAVYRAQQDQSAAIRYLIHHADEYHIDTSAVFVAGESAGGVASLFSAYVNPNEWENIAPLVPKTLGVIANSGNDLNDKFRIKGVINMWGGIIDTSLISEQDMEASPLLLFHSVDDGVVPYEQVSHPEAESKLLQGSRDIANRFKNHNGCYELHYIFRAGHAYGFSSDYLSNAISKFVTNILQHRCNSAEVENKGNITLSFVDPDSAAVMTVETKVISLSPDILQQYAGQYEARGVVLAVTVDGDHLDVAAAGQEVNEIYPVKKDIFIEKKSNIQAIFIRDSVGNVIEHRVLLNRNKEFSYRKVK